MHSESFIAGKDASLESSIATMQVKLEVLGFNVVDCSWLASVDDMHQRLLAAYGKLHRLAAHA